MKKKTLILGVISVIVVVLGATYLLWQGLKTEPDNPYKELETVKLDTFFDKQGDYYVYAQRAGCPYCDNVQGEIIEFSKINQLYVIDTRAEGNEELKDYDWDEHHKLYDEEIGEVVDGEMVLYDGLTEETLRDKYSPLDYVIKRADKKFVELNIEKEEGKVYAIRESAIIDYSDASPDNLIVAGVPTLFHIQNGKIYNYYFGDIQILKHLGIDKPALDEYIS